MLSTMKAIVARLRNFINYMIFMHEKRTVEEIKIEKQKIEEGSF